MRAFGSFLLELTAFLSMCFMLAVLMGVPVLWALIGGVLLVDLGVVLFLRQREPDEPGSLSPAWRATFRHPIES